MAEGGKLTKIKSLIKKWHSFSNNKPVGHNHSFSNNKPVGHNKDPTSAPTSDEDDYSNISHSNAVYVGKSRRRYLISSDVARHPLFQELVDRSSVVGDSVVTIECEVVLFEHLLWMIENADPQPDALHELVDFYAC